MVAMTIAGVTSRFSCTSTFSGLPFGGFSVRRGPVPLGPEPVKLAVLNERAVKLIVPPAVGPTATVWKNTVTGVSGPGAGVVKSVWPLAGVCVVMHLWKPQGRPVTTAALPLAGSAR